MSKISIRFFNDREVRAVWNEEHSKWFFAAVDIIAVLNEQADYTKNRNYWKYLKNKLKKDNPELVSSTNQLKLTAPIFVCCGCGYLHFLYFLLSYLSV